MLIPLKTIKIESISQPTEDQEFNFENQVKVSTGATATG